MATKTEKTTPAADTSAATDSKPAFAAVLEAAGATQAVDAPAVTCAYQGPTPDNTPVPGGGRWLWGIQKPGWVRPAGEGPVDPDQPTAAV